MEGLEDRQILEDLFKRGLLHKHCYTCYSLHDCKVGASKDSCDFTKCQQKCGSIFHACKQGSHDEICPLITVTCLNSTYGCTAQLLRKDVNVHLEKCPASVVVCMAEWNRFPIYTSQRRKHVPFKQCNPNGDEGQLDFDLTLRDERMLQSLKTIPRKTKLSLRNHLTRRYPAVPIPNLILSNQVKDDKDFIDLGLVDPYLGVRKIDKAQLQMKQWEDDLNTRLKGKEIPKKYWEFPELEKGNIHKHCAYCIDKQCKRTITINEDQQPLVETAKGEACGMIECRWKCGTKYHSCKASEHSLICPTYEEVDEYEWMMRGFTNLDVRFGEAYRKKKKTLDHQRPALKEARDFFQGPGEPASLLKDANGVPRPPVFPKNLFKSMSLDVNLETVTRLQNKPTQMYTFVCSQEFRRDEFAWHSKTVHDIIHGGLNNWLEHRCPMAVYGCGFSHRRLFPFRNQEHTIIFSPAVESFGITSKNPLKWKDAPAKEYSPKTLTDLPFEILEIIIDYLDSFR